MQIPADRLVEIIVREVLKELARRGVALEPPASERPGLPVPAGALGTTLEVDMTGYRTPVLTENHIRGAERHIREIVVPAGTICTMGARDLMHQRRMTLTYNGKKP